MLAWGSLCTIAKCGHRSYNFCFVYTCIHFWSLPPRHWKFLATMADCNIKAIASKVPKMKNYYWIAELCLACRNLLPCQKCVLLLCLLDEFWCKVQWQYKVLWCFTTGHVKVSLKSFFQGRTLSCTSCSVHTDSFGCSSALHATTAASGHCEQSWHFGPYSQTNLVLILRFPCPYCAFSAFDKQGRAVFTDKSSSFFLPCYHSCALIMHVECTES